MSPTFDDLCDWVGIARPNRCWIVTMRDECGTWYLEYAELEGRKVRVSGLCSERRDAKTFYTEAYAVKIAALCEARYKSQEAEQYYAPRGPFKVRSL